VPVVAGLFLVIGALIGLWSSWVLEKRRQSRAEALRWDDQLRGLAADVFTAAMEVVEQAKIQRAYTAGLWAAIEHHLYEDAEHFYRDIPDEMSREQYLAARKNPNHFTSEAWTSSELKLDELHRRMLGLQGSIDMIAPEKVRSALMQVVETSETVARRRGDEDELEKGAKALHAHAQRFIAEMRSHLGVVR
jgi:hypothetical protein